MVNKRFFIENLLVFIVCGLMIKAGLTDIVNPFFYSFVMAVFFEDNRCSNFLIGVGVAKLVVNFSLVNIIFVISLVVVVILTQLIVKKTGKKLKIWAMIPVLILSSITEMFFVIRSAETLVLAIINKFLEIAFMYAYIMFFRAIRIRGLNNRFALDELMGLSLIIVPIAMAGEKILVFGFTLNQFLIPFCILLIMRILTWKEGLFFAIVAGVGVAFNSLNFNYLSIWIFFVVGCMLVKRIGRVAMPFAIMLIDIIMGFYFNGYNQYSIKSLIPIAVMGAIFIVLPNKLIKKINLTIFDHSEEVCLNEVMIQKERQLSENLKRVSDLFLDMHNIYKRMIVGKLDSNQIEEVIRLELINSNCVKCSRYKKCFDERGVIVRSIGELVAKGLNKKKVSLIDVPTFLASVCGKTNQLIFQLNLRLNDYLSYKQGVEAEDENKILMSNQLLGVSEIISNFHMDLGLGERVFKEEEQLLIDSFLYNDIIVRECAIFKKSGVLTKAVLIVKNVGYKKVDIIKVANLFFKTKTQILDTRYTRMSGWQVVTLVKASKFDSIVGVARVAKENTSGDTYSHTMLNNNNLMVAISDGKGCGVDANLLSESTLNLIENFYKAGFSSECVIDNVNKVMSFKSGENFSAVDVCVIDQESGKVDFIKRGGTPSVIKKINHTNIIEGDSLPIGLMEQSSSTVKSYYLDSGDIVVLASDGVFDAFKSSEQFSGYINNLNIINMEDFSKEILNQAIKLNHGTILDDMTVVAVRIILNR